MSARASAIVGVDLAWGERRRDGVCFARHDGARARIEGFAYPHGDAALLAAIAARVPPGAPAFVAIDAPIVCPNATGGRPVDRDVSRRFWREEAGCHPANATRCPRPRRVAGALVAQGFRIGWELASAPRLVAEVYPHPAMVHLLRLERTFKYKRGPAATKRAEFRRLQRALRELLAREMGFVSLDAEALALLAETHGKRVEDLTDALFCALIGAWHVHHAGRRSESIGALETGFVLLPEDLRGAA